MVTRALFCLTLVSAGMTGGAFAAGANNASAADDCITESNLVPPKGSRWYYRIDRTTNRKCWYIAASASGPTTPRKVHVSVHSDLGLTGRHGNRERSESEQAALFLEFLRWKEQQGAADSRAGEPSQEASRR
jgi:hypothetical protein